MTKFSALSSRELRTAARAAGRVARGARCVVTVEADDGSWFELDAVHASHACALADSQVSLMNARGASCWRVTARGKLSRRWFYTKFAGYESAGR